MDSLNSLIIAQKEVRPAWLFCNPLKKPRLWMDTNLYRQAAPY